MGKGGHWKGFRTAPDYASLEQSAMEEEGSPKEGRREKNQGRERMNHWATKKMKKPKRLEGFLSKGLSEVPRAERKNVDGKKKEELLDEKTTRRNENLAKSARRVRREGPCNDGM